MPAVKVQGHDLECRLKVAGDITGIRNNEIIEF